MQKPQPNWLLERFARARRILTPRLPESLPSSPSRTGESARALTHTCSRRREEADSLKDLECFFDHCANEPEPFLRQPRSEFEAKIWRQQNAPVSYPSDSIFLPLVFTARLAVISLLFLALPGLSAVREVGSIGLTVNNLDREVE